MVHTRGVSTRECRGAPRWVASHEPEQIYICQSGVMVMGGGGRGLVADLLVSQAGT